MFIRLLPQVLRAITINTTSSPLIFLTVPQPQNPVHHTCYTHTIPHSFSGRLHAHTAPVPTRLPFPPPLFFWSYLASVHEHSGGMMSRALREAMLPGAIASCYNIFLPTTPSDVCKHNGAWDFKFPWIKTQLWNFNPMLALVFLLPTMLHSIITCLFPK